MKKIIMIIFVCLTGAYAETGNLHYVAKGTLVGTFVDATVQYSAGKSRYNIKVKMRAVGIAKTLSGGQVETHTSSGKIKNGEYFAKEYKIEKRFKQIHYIRRYLFDYTRKKITKISAKWKSGKKLYENRETLKYFAHNDILTLYHNVMRYKKKHASGHFAIALAGAEKEGGRLRFSLPSGKKLQKERKALDEKDADVIKVYLRRKFLSGGKGNLTFAIGKDGIADKVVLDSAKIFGKVVLKRIK